MVDPNRKINRLTEGDVDFLDECEAEFAQRFTKEDADFVAHCSKPLPEPPIVENWVNGNFGNGGGGAGGSGGGRGSPYNNRYNGGGQRRSGERGWQRRGGGYNNHIDRGYRDNRRHRHEPYPRYNESHNERHNERYNDRQNEPRSGPPMQVRRDYGNFVPASKD